MAKLILARHGESTWNQEGRWTGLTDIGLSEKGREEARLAGGYLSSTRIDRAFVSTLLRAQQTLDGILDFQDQEVPRTATPLLNEKDYGVFTGRSKEEVLREVGRDTFLLIRRSWDYPIEDGESLNDVHKRVVTFHSRSAMPHIANGENLLVVSHNNTLRAYVKDLEDVPIDSVGDIELGTAEVRIYELSKDGEVSSDPQIRKFGDVH